MKKQLRPLKRFDTYTGKREFSVTFVCPKARWWKYGHWSFVVSSEYEVSESL
jgi:hypothetical protein